VKRQWKRAGQGIRRSRYPPPAPESRTTDTSMDLVASPKDALSGMPAMLVERFPGPGFA